MGRPKKIVKEAKIDKIKVEETIGEASVEVPEIDVIESGIEDEVEEVDDSEFLFLKPKGNVIVRREIFTCKHVFIVRKDDERFFRLGELCDRVKSKKDLIVVDLSE
jgi:hypothetical protein